MCPPQSEIRDLSGLRLKRQKIVGKGKESRRCLCCGEIDESGGEVGRTRGVCKYVATEGPEMSPSDLSYDEI
jgi:hypothetical protein